MDFVRNFIYGVCMGTFEVVPGISGGTLAVLLNIYDKLIFSISNLKNEFKKNFKFLLTIALGMITGIYCFSHIISFLNNSYPLETNCLLLGLILGIVPMIFRHSFEKKFSVAEVLAFSISLIFMLVVVYFSIKSNLNEAALYEGILKKLNLQQFIKFVSVGAFASFCLMLPGCSGSMIMLVFGIYGSVMEAIKTFNFLILLPVGAGILIGIIFGSKLIHYCFVKFTKITYCVILGLILGSAFTPLTMAIQLVVSTINNQNVQVGSQNSLAFFVHIALALVVLIFGSIFSYLFSNSTEKLQMS